MLIMLQSSLSEAALLRGEHPPESENTVTFCVIHFLLILPISNQNDTLITDSNSFFSSKTRHQKSAAEDVDALYSTVNKTR